MSSRSEHSLQSYEFTFEKYLNDSTHIEADVRAGTPSSINYHKLTLLAIVESGVAPWEHV